MRTRPGPPPTRPNGSRPTADVVTRPVPLRDDLAALTVRELIGALADTEEQLRRLRPTEPGPPGTAGDGGVTEAARRAETLARQAGIVRELRLRRLRCSRP